MAGLHASVTADAAFLPPGAHGLAESRRVSLQLARADGTRMEGQTAYFAQGGRVFQAAVYAPRLKPELVEPFVSGMRFE